MKDLYFKLGIERNAGADEVAAALKLNPQMVDNAPILLDKKKRAVYDRTHAALGAIGKLRRQLGMNSGDFGFVEKYPDFALGRSAAPSAKSAQAGSETLEPEETRKISQLIGSGPKPPARFKWLAPVLLGMVAVILLLLMLTFF